MTKRYRENYRDVNHDNHNDHNIELKSKKSLKNTSLKKKSLNKTSCSTKFSVPSLFDIVSSSIHFELPDMDEDLEDWADLILNPFWGLMKDEPSKFNITHRGVKISCRKKLDEICNIATVIRPAERSTKAFWDTMLEISLKSTQNNFMTEKFFFERRQNFVKKVLSLKKSLKKSQAEHFNLAVVGTIYPLLRKIGKNSLYFFVDKHIAENVPDCSMILNDFLKENLNLSHVFKMKIWKELTGLDYKGTPGLDIDYEEQLKPNYHDILYINITKCYNTIQRYNDEYTVNNLKERTKVLKGKYSNKYSEISDMRLRLPNIPESGKKLKLISLILNFESVLSLFNP